MQLQCPSHLFRLLVLLLVEGTLGDKSGYALALRLTQGFVILSYNHKRHHYKHPQRQQRFPVFSIDTLTRHSHGEVCWLRRSFSRFRTLRKPSLNGEDHRAPTRNQAISSISTVIPYQPMYLFLVNIAAIGNVLPIVLLKSDEPSFVTGSW